MHFSVLVLSALSATTMALSGMTKVPRTTNLCGAKRDIPGLSITTRGELCCSAACGKYCCESEVTPEVHEKIMACSVEQRPAALELYKTRGILCCSAACGAYCC